MDPNLQLPAYRDVHRLVFSPDRYGKGEMRFQSKDNAVFYKPRMSLIPKRPLSSSLVRQSIEDGGTRYASNARTSGAPDQRGALEQLTKMPVDILYEIFSHLHPTDVLTLSRTTKRLREILREPHARMVWQSSLEMVRALPACPKDMSEYQYASLAFDHWCHFCLAPGVEEIAWLCRVRCCQKCLKREFISEDELDLWTPNNVLIEKPDLIFPFMLSQKRVGGRNQPVYYLPRVLEYLAELDPLSKANDEEALKKWSEEKKEQQAARVAHAGLCEYWYTHWAYCRAYNSTPTFLWELAIVVWLSILLTGLWRDKVYELADKLCTLRS